MADPTPRTPAAVLLLLAPDGAAASGLLLQLNGHLIPQSLPAAVSSELLIQAHRLLQLAQDGLVSGSNPPVADDAPTEPAKVRGPGAARALKAGPFQVDGPHRLVRWRGPQGWRPIDLTDVERRLMCQLLAAAGQVCSRSDIAAGVWGSQAHNLRTVDQCVRRLRRSMLAAGVPDCIRTVRGVGYRLVPAVASARSAPDSH